MSHFLLYSNPIRLYYLYIPFIYTECNDFNSIYTQRFYDNINTLKWHFNLVSSYCWKNMTTGWNVDYTLYIINTLLTPHSCLSTQIYKTQISLRVSQIHSLKYYVQKRALKHSPLRSLELAKSVLNIALPLDSFFQSGPLMYSTEGAAEPLHFGVEIKCSSNARNQE